MASAKNQIGGLQILRAIAVFLVAWLHSSQTLEGWRCTELPHFWAYGIDIFFVISGFIMATVILRTPPGTAWQFLKRRLVRIFPIYWIFAGFVALRLAHSHNFSRNYLLSLLLLPRSPRYPLLLAVSWTLIFEMFFYYTLWLILLVTIKRAVPVAIVFLSCAVLIGQLANLQNPILITFTSPILLEFVFGAIGALFFFRFGKQRRLGIAVVLTGVAVSLYLRTHPLQGGALGIDMVFSSHGAMRHAFTWGLGATLIVCGVVFWFPSTERLPARIAVALGDSSYSAYLVSAIVIEFVGRVLLRVGGHATIGKEILFQSLMVACVFVAGWLSYKIVEHPMILWLNRH